MGLLAVLLRWWVGPNRGAFEKMDRREAAKEMLLAIVKVATAGRSITLDVRLAVNCVWAWPGPLAGENPSSIDIDDSVVHLAEFREVQGAGTRLGR